MIAHRIFRGFTAALLAAFVFLPAFALAEDASQTLVSGQLKGKLLVGGSGRVFLLDTAGHVAWEHRAALVHDAWMLPSGNVLYADGTAVTEVAPDGKVVFSYRPQEQKGGGAYACQRLENGSTLVGENSTGRVLEVDPAGKIIFTLATSPVKPGDHHNMRMVRKLSSGNYLVCHSGSHIVKEYAPDGKVVQEIKTPNLAFAAIRTPKGTTLVSTLDKLLEYDAEGNIVWQFTNKDIPDVTITNMTGMHLLCNGNIAVGCYSAYKGGKGAGLFEITRDGKLVWRYSNPSKDGSMMAIQCLDVEGKPLSGECLR